MKIYVAATRQNDGKTTVCLGLIAALRTRVRSVGYIKAVGQRYIEINGHKVDEDALLIKEVYELKGSVTDMSPIAVPSGFTEAYIRNPDRAALVKAITEAYERVSEGKDAVVIEGTGHAGVGSVFDMSNADVSKLLGCKVLIVSSGGIGKPIDEVMLNKAMFDQAGVEVIGVVINKVLPEKFDKISEMARAGFARKGVELLGVIPYYQPLSNPTVEQLLDDIDGELLNGERHLRNVVGNMVIGAMPPHEALDYIKEDTLLITPGTREDLILAAMSSSLVGKGTQTTISGIILTGGKPPHPNVMALIRQTPIPVILVKEDTFTLAAKVDHLIVKIRPTDYDKIRDGEDLVEKHVNIERIIELIQAGK